MMVALGFREQEGGVICLPLDVNMYEISARMLELEVGLEFLKKRIMLNSEVELKLKKTETLKQTPKIDTTGMIDR